MGYSDSLRNIIEKSNLSFKEIAEKCKEIGKAIDPSYISKLVNGKLPPPSDEVSSIIAKACGENPDKLILEGYIEKAPEVLVNFINKVRTYNKGRNLLSDNEDIKEENFKIINAALEQQPLSEFILNYQGLDFALNNVEIPMNDDSMEPIIPRDSELIITKANGDSKQIFVDCAPEPDKETLDTLYKIGTDTVGFLNYKNGDIIVAWDIDDSKLLIRSFQRLEEEYYALVPMNRYHEIKIYDITKTCFNMANIIENQIVLDEKAINAINYEYVDELDGKEIRYKPYIHNICIIGKVEKVVIDINNKV